MLEAWNEVLRYLSAENLDFVLATGINCFDQRSANTAGSACNSNDTHICYLEMGLIERDCDGSKSVLWNADGCLFRFEIDC